MYATIEHHTPIWRSRRGSHPHLPHHRGALYFELRLQVADFRLFLDASIKDALVLFRFNRLAGLSRPSLIRIFIRWGWCNRRESNPHELCSYESESYASANSATVALFGTPGETRTHINPVKSGDRSQLRIRRHEWWSRRDLNPHVMFQTTRPQRVPYADSGTGPLVGRDRFERSPPPPWAVCLALHQRPV